MGDVTGATAQATLTQETTNGREGEVNLVLEDF